MWNRKLKNNVKWRQKLAGMGKKFLNTFLVLGSQLHLVLGHFIRISFSFLSYRLREKERGENQIFDGGKQTFEAL